MNVTLQCELTKEAVDSMEESEKSRLFRWLVNSMALHEVATIVRRAYTEIGLAEFRQLINEEKKK